MSASSWQKQLQKFKSNKIFYNKNKNKMSMNLSENQHFCNSVQCCLVVQKFSVINLWTYQQKPWQPKHFETSLCRWPNRSCLWNNLTREYWLVIQAVVVILPSMKELTKCHQMGTEWTVWNGCIKIVFGKTKGLDLEWFLSNLHQLSNCLYWSKHNK